MPKDRINASEFINLLIALRDSGLVRLVGSYARGQENTGDHLSDIDLYILQGAEGMKKIIEIHERHGIKWESHVIGSIGTPRNAEYMPVPIECSYLFTGFKTRSVKAINVYGVKFKAYSY